MALWPVKPNSKRFKYVAQKMELNATQSWKCIRTIALPASMAQKVWARTSNKGANSVETMLKGGGGSLYDDGNENNNRRATRFRPRFFQPRGLKTVDSWWYLTASISTCACVSALRMLALRLRQDVCMLRAARVMSDLRCAMSRSVAVFISPNWRRNATTARHSDNSRLCSAEKYSLNDCKTKHRRSWC